MHFSSLAVDVCFGLPCEDASVRPALGLLCRHGFQSTEGLHVCHGNDLTLLGNPTSQPRPPCLGPHTSSDLGFSFKEKDSHNLQIC